MKTYSEHLKTTQSFGETIDPKKKPVMRSSAIFPVMTTIDLDSRVSFMGYWLLKRHLKEVSILFTLRDEGGSILQRGLKTIDEIKCHLVSVKEMLEQADIQGVDANHFTGSLEMEIFSTRDMVFPYPAFVLNYSGKNSSTFVHTAGRVFNDAEDLLENNAVQVAESGFDVVPVPGFLPYFAFVNGTQGIESQEIGIELINYLGEKSKKTIHLKNVKPYQTCYIFPVESSELGFFKENKGTVKISHDFKGFFPRFIAGNFNKKDSILTLTHTFYDTINHVDESAYWQNDDTENMHDADIFFPVFLDGKNYTELVLYPIYSPAHLSLDLEFYDEAGAKISSAKNVASFDTKDTKPLYLNLKDHLVSNTSLDADTISKIKGARLSFDNGGRIPARLKFGLNVGMPGVYDIPTNICFNAKVANPKILSKPGTFKWAPILNTAESIVIVDNASFEKNYDRTADVAISFWREEDNTSITRNFTLQPFGQYRFDLKDDKEIQEFIDGGTGWVTITSPNGLINAWYFELFGNGVVGGDHSF